MFKYLARYTEVLFSHSRSGFPLILPMWDNPHTRTSLGKDQKKKKKETAARRPHAGRTSIRDVIVMLKLCHHVASQRIQDFLEVCFVFFQNEMRYLVVSKKNNALFVWGWERKHCPAWSPFIITCQASWCQSVVLGTEFCKPRILSLFLNSFNKFDKTRALM